ncbi:MAG: EAL domain-containing protein [Magnetococcales bacterium]|nr:EAL domain-containing protein [Magnetococcales bacterium]
MAPAALLAALPQPVMALRSAAMERGGLDILFWNPVCQQLSGLTASDIRHVAAVTRLFGDGPWPDDAIIERMWQCRNGVVRTLRWSRLPLGHNSEAVWYIGQDVTEHRRIEEQLRIMTSVFGNAMSEVEQQIHVSRQMVENAVEYDALTGLPNRTLFRDHLSRALLNADRTLCKVALALFDLDLFETINDTLGYASGDLLLLEVAQRLSHSGRYGATICRLDGDEFALILENVVSLQEVIYTVQQLFDAMKAPVILQGQEVYVGTSCGIAIYPNNGYDGDSLIKHASLALHRAKRCGRHNFQFYTESMDVVVSQRLAMETRLRRALERGELTVHYQPKLDLRSHRIIGVEALTRWPSSQGMIAPSEFIPLAEETGLILPLGEWMLRHACLEMKEMVSLHQGDFRAAINLSVMQLQQPDFVRKLMTILAETGLQPQNLELEITESLMMADVEQARRALAALNEMGIHISVDDFGTGYSSLSYLKRLPLRALKIDQSFVRDLVENSDDAAIITAIISMAHSLGMDVVAEGVETIFQMNFLRNHGCDHIQGYHISRPLPFDALVRMMGKQNG